VRLALGFNIINMLPDLLINNVIAISFSGLVNDEGVEL